MSYIFDSSEAPDERKRRRQLAEALMAKGMSAEPIRSPWQGAANMAQALMGGIELGMLDKQDREGRAEASKLMDAAMGGGQSASPSPVASALAGSAPQTPSFVATGGKMVNAPSDLMPYFEEASKMTGIPAPILMAKVRQESNFNPNAVGGAKEVGLTQILPSTARDPGFGLQGVDPASLRDPRTNIMFGAQYLAARGKAAGVTDWTDRNQVAKALTAYNGGGDPNYASNVMRFLPNGPLSPAAKALAGGGGQPAMAGGDTLAPAQPQGAPAAPAVPAGLMGAGQDTGAQQQAILRAMQSPYITPAQKQVLALKYQSLQKDPTVELQRQQLQFNIEEAKRKSLRDAQRDPLELQKLQRDLNDVDRITAPDGQVWERPKGQPDAQWKPTIKLGDKPPTEVAEFEYGQKNPAFAQRQLELKRAGASNVTIDQKSEGEFEKKVAEGQAKLFNSMAEEGVNAKAEIGQIRTLRGQIEALPGGFLGGAQALASSYGIKLGPNASNIEAAQAIISKLVPTQKAPGSGTISDRDLDLFKSSLPALSNTPGGNKMILDTMEALSIHKQRQSDIATQVLTGEMTRKEAMKALRDLPDPLENVTKALRDMKKTAPSTPAPAPAPTTAPGVDPVEAEMRRRGLLK